MDSEASAHPGVESFGGRRDLDPLAGEKLRQTVRVVRIGTGHQRVALHRTVTQPDGMAEEGQEIGEPFLLFSRPWSSGWPWRW